MAARFCAQPAHLPLQALPFASAQQGRVGMNREHHCLDCDHIDALDELNGEEQLASVWCRDHLEFEWHSIPRWRVQHGGTVTFNTKPIKW
jgi:hypothetical protein